LESTTRLNTFILDTATLPEWPYQEQRGFDLTASAPVSDVSAPAAQMGYGPFFIQFLKDVGAEYEDVPLF